MTPYLLKLPWPPSVNRLYRTFQGRMLLSRQGRIYYRDAVAIATAQRRKTLTCRLAVLIEASPPDRRPRDLDNLIKPILDLMQTAQVYRNDNQVDDLRIVRKPPVKDGSLTITIRQQPGEG